MKSLILFVIVSSLALSRAAAQTVRLSENFESTPIGELPGGWAASDPSAVAVEATSLPGFGTRAARIQGSASSLSSAMFSPARRGHVSLDMVISSEAQQYDLEVLDGGGQFNSIIRFNADGTISSYRSAGTSLFYFGLTSGTWSQGVQTHLAIDYSSGAILQDGVVISSTSDLSLSTFGAVGAHRLRVAATGGGSGEASILIDNVSFLACEVPVSLCPGAPNSVSSIAGAEMFLTGSPYLSTNDVRFTLFGMPPNAPMLLFHGGGTGNVPLGDGNLCIAAGAQGLFRGAVGLSGAGDPPFAPAAEGSITVNLDAAPYVSGASAILAGASWNFQAAYRDSTTFGTGFNFSSAVMVTFCM